MMARRSYCATGAVPGRPPFTLAPGGSGRLWVRQPPPSSGTALRPTRCWMDGWSVNSCLSPAQSWGHRPGRRQELVSFKHSARPKAAGLAATSPACSERRDRRRGGEVAARLDKKYQRFHSAWAVQPDKGPSPCPWAGADGAAAPRAPSSHSPVLADTGRVTGKATAHVPQGTQVLGEAAVMHPWCSIQSINWVHRDACGCSTHIWVSWDKGKGGQCWEQCRGGDGLGWGAAAAPSALGSSGESLGDMSAGSERGCAGDRTLHNVPGGEPQPLQPPTTPKSPQNQELF